MTSSLTSLSFFVPFPPPIILLYLSLVSDLGMQQDAYSHKRTLGGRTCEEQLDDAQGTRRRRGGEYLNYTVTVHTLLLTKGDEANNGKDTC